jgi:hypothetical protein
MTKGAPHEDASTRRSLYSAPLPTQIPGAVEESQIDPQRVSEILRHQGHLGVSESRHATDEMLDSPGSYRDDVRGPAELDSKRQILSKSDHVLAAGNPRPVPQLVPTSIQQAHLGELDANHAKLMVLISHFGTCAANATESETWLRSVSLLVLIYEGIQLRVFDFDFAPQSCQVNHSEMTRRLYMNISQEGCGAIDDLLEWSLIRSLKMISKHHHLITAYQITEKGRLYAEGVDDEHRNEVSRLAFGPKPYHRELVDVEFVGSTFVITTPSGYSKESGITDVEVRVPKPSTLNHQPSTLIPTA